VQFFRASVQVEKADQLAEAISWFDTPFDEDMGA
jgi:hypothetical protein